MKAAQTRSSGQLRLLAPALICWAATALLLAKPGWVLTMFIAGGACSIALGALSVVLLRDRRVRRFFQLTSVLAASLTLLTAILFVGQGARTSSDLNEAASAHSRVTVQVSLDGYPATTESMFGEQTWVHARDLRDRVRVLLWFDGAVGAAWGPATKLTIQGTVDAQESTSSAAFAISVDEWLEVEQKQRTFSSVAIALRTGLRAHAEEAPGAELLPGLAVGDTELVTPELDEAMKRSSLTHLTAVSGANCALIIIVSLWATRHFGVPRRHRVVIAAVGLSGFVVVVGPDPSVQRATVMATVMLVSAFGSKRAVGLPSLGVAVIVLLALDPWQALHPGFALSVAATAGILVLTTPITKWLKKRVRLPTVIAMPTAVAIAAQFACSPLLILLDPSIPAVGVLANVLAAPAAPFGTGIGLLAALLIPLSAFVGDICVWLGSLAAGWIAATAEVTSRLPFARLPWIAGTFGALILATVQALTVVSVTLFTGSLRVGRLKPVRPRQPWQSHVDHLRDRPRSVVLIATLCGAVATAVSMSIIVVVPVATQVGTPKDWVVVACDVGQGDALLVRDPDHREFTMLIDTGDDPVALETCLTRFGVGSIALAVLTHDDRDHVGALDSVIDRIETALVAPNLEGEPTRHVTTTLRESGVPTVVGVVGTSGSLGLKNMTPGSSGVMWRVLSPNRSAPVVDRNASSIVLAVEVQGVQALFLGDTGESEQMALGRNEDLAVFDVVKVAHHGSRDQDSDLYRQIDAKIGLVSSGADNSYGHPSAQTLKLLLESGTTPVRTDEFGSVALRMQDGELTVWTER